MSSKSDYEDVDGLVIPGVGSYTQAAEYLVKMDWDIIKKLIEKKKPVLGVCLGMQLLTSRGTEGGGASGLNHFTGSTIPLASKNMAQIRPALNIGWRKIHITTRGSQSSKIAGCDTSGYYYFAHSYTINVPEDQIFANSEFSE